MERYEEARQQNYEEARRGEHRLQLLPCSSALTVSSSGTSHHGGDRLQPPILSVPPFQTRREHHMSTRANCLKGSDQGDQNKKEQDDRVSGVLPFVDGRTRFFQHTMLKTTWSMRPQAASSIQVRTPKAELRAGDAPTAEDLPIRQCPTHFLLR